MQYFPNLLNLLRTVTISGNHRLLRRTAMTVRFCCSLGSVDSFGSAAVSAFLHLINFDLNGKLAFDCSLNVCYKIIFSISASTMHARKKLVDAKVVGRLNFRRLHRFEAAEPGAIVEAA